MDGEDQQLGRPARGDNADRDGDLDSDLLRPSGAILAAQISLSNAIEQQALFGLGHDSTTYDLLVRLHLAPEHRLRAVDLCHQLLLSPSHVSRMLDRAERDGLVRRQPDPDDRRANQVFLTAEGERAVRHLAPRLHAVLDAAIFQTLDATEVDTLVDLLARIEAAARRVSLDGGNRQP